METEKPKQIHLKYDASLKRRVIEEYLSGNYNKSELRRKYNVKSNAVITCWIKSYEKEQEELLSLSMAKPSDTGNTDNSKQSKSIQELQEELKLAKLKINGLETMIDIAEKTFKINIRKKSGAKPSSE